MGLDDLESVVPPPRRQSPPTPKERRNAPPARHRGGSRNTRGHQPRPADERPAMRRSPRERAAPAHPAIAAELPVRTMGVRFGDLAPIPTVRRVDPEPYHCFNCWQRGHDALQSARPQVMPFCHNCGRRGVNIADCPRCRAAYRRRAAGPPRDEPRRRREGATPSSSRDRPEPYARRNSPSRGRRSQLAEADSRPSRRPTDIQEAISLCAGFQRYSLEVGATVLRSLYMRRTHRE